MLVFNIKPYSQKDLILFAETRAVTQDPVREFLVSSLAEDSNALSFVCVSGRTPGTSLRAASLSDINALWDSLEADTLRAYAASATHKPYFEAYQRSIERLTASGGPSALLDALIAHYSAFGGGAESRYIAYTWDGFLRGISEPDDIRFDCLYSIERQKQTVIENTERFLHGLPANNMLLCGTSGSGKSSLVKAALNEYAEKGLRLVELPKSRLSELPALFYELNSRIFRYVIFLDDLSFETDEPEYKSLKAALDGQIQKQPQNTLLYATSNRRHLVRETWAERDGDELHVRDTMTEKLSLSERFGLSVYFAPPSQSEYLDMIRGILSGYGIAIDENLEAEAIKWELRYHGRSGRTAMQFARTVIARLNALQEAEL